MEELPFISHAHDIKNDMQLNLRASLDTVHDHQMKSSFASHPKAKYWSKRNKISPDEISGGSAKKFWFNCDCGHVFESSLNNITHGKWCPYCANKKLCGCDNCLAKTFASHPRANHWSNRNEKPASEIFISSNKKFWLDCNCGHDFQAVLYSVVQGSWCPYCSSPPSQLCDCDKCIANSFASHPKARFWSKRNTVRPESVFRNSNKKFWFDCLCGHAFETSADSVTTGAWCRYCSSPPGQMCGCDKCIAKSFARHPKAKFWSKRNTVKPESVFRSTNKKFWFDCVCGHEFRSSLSSITSLNWCPYCSSQRMCGCDKCIAKSFASHPRARFWSKRNTVRPETVFRNSGKKFWFDCDCGHVFESALNNITHEKWCPYCSLPPKQLCDCDKCIAKSFASHPKAQNWSKRNTVGPESVFRNSNEKFWFICEYGHEFRSKLSHITAGCWCPWCKKKTEAKLALYLKALNVDPQPKYEWCRSETTNKYLPFDFVIERYRVIVELDGEQHFKQVSNWNPPEETQATDRYKASKAFDNGYTIIRLKQEDVWFDRIDWKEMLVDRINTAMLTKRGRILFINYTKAERMLLTPAE